MFVVPEARDFAKRGKSRIMLGAVPIGWVAIEGGKPMNRNAGDCVKRGMAYLKDGMFGGSIQF